MNLYFRFLFMLIRLLFKKKQGVLDVFERTFIIWPNDLDLNLHVNNGRYLTLMDLGRIDALIKADLHKAVLKNRWFPVLGSAKIHYLKPLHVFDHFKLTTQIVYWDDKWMYMQQQFWHHGQLKCTSFVRFLFLKRKHKVTPQELLSAINYHEQSPDPSPELWTWIQSEKDRSSNRDI